MYSTCSYRNTKHRLSILKLFWKDLWRLYLVFFFTTLLLKRSLMRFAVKYLFRYKWKNGRKNWFRCCWNLLCGMLLSLEVGDNKYNKWQEILKYKPNDGGIQYWDASVSNLTHAWRGKGNPSHLWIIKNVICKIQQHSGFSSHTNMRTNELYETFGQHLHVVVE